LALQTRAKAPKSRADIIAAETKGLPTNHLAMRKPFSLPCRLKSPFAVTERGEEDWPQFGGQEGAPFRNSRTPPIGLWTHQAISLEGCVQKVYIAGSTPTGFFVTALTGKKKERNLPLHCAN